MISSLLPLLSLVAAQKPPAACEAVCNPVVNRVDGCKLTSAPTSQTEWNDATLRLANCICPAMTASEASNCSGCLLLSASADPGTATFQQYLKACQSGTQTAAVEIGKLYGQTISAFSAANAPAPSSKPNSAHKLTLGLGLGLVAFL